MDSLLAIIPLPSLDGALAIIACTAAMLVWQAAA
jgi:hypothetical protein